MSQNIYDNKEFFQEYNQLFRQVHGLENTPEWPILKSMVGDVQGKKILELGCGSGWFSRWAGNQGAESIRGIDLSENMLQKARSLTSDAKITYERADLQTITLPGRTYDLVYSNLALHYLPDLRSLFQQVYGSLKPGSRFVFAVEHPLFTAPSEPSWKVDQDGLLFWPLNNYMNEGLRITDWLVKGLRKQHRPVEGYLTPLFEAGFIVVGLREFFHDQQPQSSTLPPQNSHTGFPYHLFVAAEVPMKAH